MPWLARTKAATQHAFVCQQCSAAPAHARRLTTLWPGLGREAVARAWRGAHAHCTHSDIGAGSNTTRIFFFFFFHLSSSALLHLHMRSKKTRML